MPENTLRVAAFAHVQRQAQQLGRAFDRLAVHDLRDAQVDLGEIVDRDRRRDGFAAGQAVSRRGAPVRGGGSNRASSCLMSTRCIRCSYVADRMPDRPSGWSASVQRRQRHGQEVLDLLDERRQDRRQVDGQNGETPRVVALQTWCSVACDLLRLAVRPGLLGQLPGLLLVP